MIFVKILHGRQKPAGPRDTADESRHCNLIACKHSFNFSSDLSLTIIISMPFHLWPTAESLGYPPWQQALCNEMMCNKKHTQAPWEGPASAGCDLPISRLQDTSTGEVAACLNTKMGDCSVMRQNPWNACLALGHANGVVTMWAPNMGLPLVRMLCHKVGQNGRFASDQ